MRDAYHPQMAEKTLLQASAPIPALCIVFRIERYAEDALPPPVKNERLRAGEL
ncbi:hypothetical protein ASZ90_010664 [hydrocarbon metagenome]|uniref:Uncharacterized protein n=1 Tax=hydrocarbon metagenome TaxID=938273 RepID=A0A0W8FFD7_9ZZZZ